MCSSDLLAEIDIGEDAAQFMKSQLGRYIVGRLNAEIADLDGKLRSTFPLRWKRVMQLQNDIAIREKIKAYLLEAIQSGRSALAELSRRQGEVEHG